MLVEEGQHVKPRGKHTAGKKLDFPLHIHHAGQTLHGGLFCPLCLMERKGLRASALLRVSDALC